MRHTFKTLQALLLALLPTLGHGQGVIDLSGQWTLADTAGVTVDKAVTLPGTLDEAGIGHAPTLPLEMGREQLRHLARRHAFVGEATYVRTIDVPKAMANRPLTVTLERVLWQSRLTVDGVLIDRQESLVAPHVFRQPKGLKAGRHELRLTVDNRRLYDISYELMAHAYTDETQIRWNGVLGRMTMETEEGEDVKCQMLNGGILRVTTKARKPRFEVDGVAVEGRKAKGKGLKDNGEGTWEVTLPDGLATWDEFSPTLHTLTICRSARGSRAKSGRGRPRSQTIRFGVRTLENRGGRLHVNGRPTFLRGTLECCIFPLTGTPPTDDAGWRKVFATAREWGLNHLRFHSYCPPDAAFRVADSLGFYLQVELPVWSLTLGQDTAACRFLRQEFDRIITHYGHHPSLCLISCGNELQPDFTLLNDLTAYMKRRDPARLHTTTTFTFEKGHGGRPEPEDEYFVTQWTDHGWVRGQGIFDSEPPAFDRNYDAALREVRVPFVSHEIGQYAVYPNLQEISKYTGVLDPLNLRAIRQDMERKGLLGEADQWTHASGRLAYILYKEEVERALKTRRQSGFQLLGLQDFPGQSTALVGLVDAFWDGKGACTPEEFRQACSPVTPLANFPKAVYTNREQFRAELLVANYGSESLRGKRVRWELCPSQSSSSKCKVQSAKLEGEMTIASDGFGQLTLDSIRVDLSGIDRATRFTLSVAIEGTEYRNSWPVWVYPDTPLPDYFSPARGEMSEGQRSGSILLTQDVNEALAALAEGRSVLLSPRPEQMRGLEGKFVPVFWSPVHFPDQAGPMGILCDPEHPALADFPTEGHTDWQWWHLVKQAKVMVTDSVPQATPIVRAADNFANNRRLALAVEARVGRGRLLLTSMNLLAKTDRPEARQLLRSLLAYMQGDQFNPTGTLAPDDLQHLTEVHCQSYR